MSTLEICITFLFVALIPMIVVLFLGLNQLRQKEKDHCKLEASALGRELDMGKRVSRLERAKAVMINRITTLEHRPNPGPNQ